MNKLNQFMNVVFNDHEYAKTKLDYILIFGYFQVKTDCSERLWTRVIIYYYSNEYFTLYPTKVEDDIVTIKYALREPKY